jgi:LPXTG-motif cell wall-anchored protein
MKIARIIAYISAGLLALVVAILPPQAKADEWNQKTIMTFNAPVEIPGQVLSPGTYVFKLMDSQSDRNIVEVFNKNENHLYGTFLAIPDYRLKPRGKPIITFEERASGAPEAVKAWFYPGDNYGHEFVYPKVKAMALAKANNEAVPSMPNEMAANTTKQVKSMNEPSVMAMRSAPLKAEQPNQEEAEITEVFTPPPAQAAQPAPASAPAPAKMPKRLPQTGSPLPLIALLGLASLGAAGSLRLLAAKMK